MAKRHIEEHPEFGAMGIFAGYGEVDSWRRAEAARIRDIPRSLRLPAEQSFLDEYNAAAHKTAERGS